MSKSTKRGRGSRANFKVLHTAQNGLSLVGECTFFVNMGTATIKLSYALAEDAVRVCALVSAVPGRVVGDCASLASFNYDRPLYDKLRDIRDDRIGAIRAAYERGEEVNHVIGTGEPLDDRTEPAVRPMASHESHEGSSISVSARFPLKQAGQR